MGNTNLPQDGAAHQKNSRDTRSGAAQISDQEGEEPRKLPDAPVVPPDPAVTPEEAIAGHVGTGHSPPDAT